MASYGLSTQMETLFPLGTKTPVYVNMRNHAKILETYNLEDEFLRIGMRGQAQKNGCSEPHAPSPTQGASDSVISQLSLTISRSRLPISTFRALGKFRGQHQ